MIVCRDLTKSSRGVTAVHAVSLDISPGICGLLGANGAGKSTLLKLLTGLAIPDSGSAEIAGINTASRSVEICKLIGVLPEDLGLFDDLTIREHLQLTGPIYGLSSAETDNRAEMLLRMLRLGQVSGTMLRECSFGMRKKTALAMALLHSPRVLFLDEPFEGIDPSSSRVIEATLTSFAERGGTILLTSHILSLIQRLASRILIMQHGAVVWDSRQTPLSGSLEDAYFDLVGQPQLEELPWLGS
jgi:ABC-2 type transport system ATP-binding protein